MIEKLLPANNSDMKWMLVVKVPNQFVFCNPVNHNGMSSVEGKILD